MIRYDFTRQAERELLKLPRDLQQRILLKIEYYLSQPRPLTFARQLTGGTKALYRFRIGDYRVTFNWEGDCILILEVGHRREIYRR